MAYLVIAVFMRQFETHPAGTREEACAIARVMLARKASRVGIVDVGLDAVWGVDDLCPETAPDA
jgi:hypothetical protein